MSVHNSEFFREFSYTSEKGESTPLSEIVLYLSSDPSSVSSLKSIQAKEITGSPDEKIQELRKLFAKELKSAEPPKKEKEWVTGKTAKIAGFVLKRVGPLLVKKGEAKEVSLGNRRMMVIRTERKTTVGSYSEELGRGTYGEVYKFSNAAVKVGDGRSLEVENEILGDIHKNGEVVGVEQSPRKFVDKEKSQVGLMKHLYLGNSVQLFQQLNEPQSKMFLRFGPLFRGLRGVHSAGYRHGDIKPTNILFDKKGMVLADFGGAARLGSTDKAVVTPLFAPATLMKANLTPEEEKRQDLHALGLSTLILITIRSYIEMPGSLHRREDIPIYQMEVKIYIEELLEAVEDPEIKDLLSRTLYQNTEGVDLDALMSEIISFRQ